jgi:16S rRNA A1518/A1519 N6-dimethyltransferase RsmA/KsgA/DIM1 with predicted DNA glycosylase/AP lyase activity
MSISLLGATEIREIAKQLHLHPAKSLGQNFVIDGNTCQKIVRLAGIEADDHVVEIGPGLGSLTLALLQLKSMSVLPNNFLSLHNHMASKKAISVSSTMML